MYRRRGRADACTITSSLSGYSSSSVRIDNILNDTYIHTYYTNVLSWEDKTVLYFHT